MLRQSSDLPSSSDLAPKTTSLFAISSSDSKKRSQDQQLAGFSTQPDKKTRIQIGDDYSPKPVLSINFRTKRFNLQVDKLIKRTYTYLYVDSAAHFPDKDFADSLNQVYSALTHYYATECRVNYLGPNEGANRAKAVFSEYCQNLIYYITHNAKDRNAGNRALTIVVDHPLFSYVDQEGQRVIWCDPQENITALNVACRGGHVETVRKLLKMAMESSSTFEVLDRSDDVLEEGEIKACELSSKGNFKDFIKVLTLPDKDQFAPLNTASKEGHTEIVRDLLAIAEIAFGGKATEGFRTFLTHPNKDQFSALNTASKEGHKEVVCDLLAAAEIAFGGKATEGFRSFLTHLDKDQFSPLNTASKEGHIEIVRDLLATAEIAFGGKATEGFRSFLTQLNKDQFSPLNTASTEGHTEVVRDVLAAGEIAFGGKATEGFHSFLSHPNKDQFSPLNAASCAGHKEIVRDLLVAGEIAFGGKATDGFRTFLTHLDRDQFSPLNSASFAGHTEIVRDLLAAAEIAFGGKATEGFRRFLIHMDKDQFSPLNTASKEGHTEVVRDLLAVAEIAFGGKETQEFKQFLEQQNKHGFTPLNAASRARKDEIVKLLIAYGADPNVKNKRGYSAKDHAPSLFAVPSSVSNTRSENHQPARFFSAQSDKKTRIRVSDDYSSKPGRQAIDNKVDYRHKRGRYLG